MALPGNLSYFLSRMQGVSTNYFKIFPYNTGTATPSKILRFELPTEQQFAKFTKPTADVFGVDYGCNCRWASSKKD